MVKKICIAAVLMLLMSSGFAKGKKHHLNYDEYIEMYGTDDTSVAIINLFFDKRENMGKGQMSLLPLTTAISFVAPPIGLSLTAISCPLFINGVRVHYKYNHKNLLKALKKYHEDDIVANRYKKQVFSLLKANEDLYTDEVMKKDIKELKSIRGSEEKAAKNNSGVTVKKHVKLI